jgi:hypothetical protein
MMRLLVEPVWLELIPGVRAQLQPITRFAVRHARAAAAKALADDGEDREGAGDALSEELIRQGLIGWEGIGDEAGEVLAFTPANVEHVLKNDSLFSALDAQYVMPWVLAENEKNASALSRLGTSGATIPAKPIAETARPSAKTARTRPTRSKPTPPKTPGK